MRAVLGAVLLVAIACSSGGVAPSPKPSAAATPSPAATPLRLKPPIAAILEDVQVGLPRVSGRDHLSASEAASTAADQPLALQTYTSWGWSDESTRSWSDGRRAVDDLVLLTLRSSGARLAFAYYAQQSQVQERLCTADLSKLDGCHVGMQGDRVIVTGWLGEEVFVVAASGVDVSVLADLQAQRLRA